MEKLHECRLILPKSPLSSEHKDWQAEHGQLVQEFIGLWGGVTITEGEGFWKDPSDGAIVREPVFIYDVALPETDWPAFVFAAKQAGEQMRQKTVYVRDGRNAATVISLQHKD